MQAGLEVPHLAVCLSDVREASTLPIKDRDLLAAVVGVINGRPADELGGYGTGDYRLLVMMRWSMSLSRHTTSEDDR
jgi:hypothetical protein